MYISVQFSIILILLCKWILQLKKSYNALLHSKIKIKATVLIFYNSSINTIWIYGNHKMLNKNDKWDHLLWIDFSPMGMILYDEYQFCDIVSNTFQDQLDEPLDLTAIRTNWYNSLDLSLVNFSLLNAL